ncbi:PaaX family transcriptional regulator C-terminal domain-containing protein [Georgenia alba]|uniref:PaaX family transcriptional regulator C-terminal domain-containing protein n=1 Tax=Georgenia alba TaxID=2233858 RepID=A0ABW2QAH0_9MICO
MSERAAHLPRRQRGAQPQRLLTTLLGDYWFARSDPLPSAVLVQLLGEFGITSASARAAIQRLAARGFLVSERRGRQTWYAVPPKSEDVIQRHVRNVFGPPGPESWDGQWTVVSFSAPDPGTRRLLRESLRRLRFGRLDDGSWISPWHRPDELATLDAHATTGRLTVFRGQHVPLGGERDLTEAFDLDSIAARYRAFTKKVRGVDAEPGASDPSRALRVRTETMAAWRRVMADDPQLPEQLLPPGWPGTAARAACVRIYDGLGPTAQRRFRGIVAEHAPDLAGLVTHHTFRGHRAETAPTGRRRSP